VWKRSLLAANRRTRHVWWDEPTNSARLPGVSAKLSRALHPPRTTLPDTSRRFESIRYTGERDLAPENVPREARPREIWRGLALFRFLALIFDPPSSNKRSACSPDQVLQFRSLGHSNPPKLPGSLLQIYFFPIKIQSTLSPPFSLSFVNTPKGGAVCPNSYFDSCAWLILKARANAS